VSGALPYRLGPPASFGRRPQSLVLIFPW
jgi:hypothetical protein